MRKRQFCYEWPRPGVTVDIALFTVTGALNDLRPQVLLVERTEPPWQGQWALPGGFVRENEDLLAAARRELQEEAGVTEVTLEQVEAVGTPGRDTRGHIITVVYVGLTAGDRHRLISRGDARNARWFDVAGPELLPVLAFDHALLLQRALEHLRQRISESALCFDLLPETFTLSELQALMEAILGRPLDRRNFRRKVHDLGFLVPAEGTRSLGGHRPAQLYRFVPKQFEAYRAQSRALPF
jgi:8-oxo-dGTP diphosphatase